MSDGAKAKFPMGRVRVSPGVMAASSAHRVYECLEKHAAGDWGLLDADDCARNALELIAGGPVMSAYALDPALPSLGHGPNTIWIITEGDRTMTTVLLPDEY